MELRKNILESLDYFQNNTEAITATFIRIADEFVYSIEQPGFKPLRGSVPLDELDAMVDKWSPTHKIEIISQLNKDGQYDVPDIQRLDFESSIDY